MLLMGGTVANWEQLAWAAGALAICFIVSILALFIADRLGWIKDNTEAARGPIGVQGGAGQKRINRDSPVFLLCPGCKAEVFEVDDASRTRRIVLDEKAVTLLKVADGKVCGTVQGYQEHHCARSTE